MKRTSSVLAIAAIALLMPAPVLAHGLVGRLVSPLPLAVYLAGAGAAVALSFAFVLRQDARAVEPAAERLVRVPAWLRLGLRAIGLLAWIWIVAQTLIGGSSVAEVGSLFLWVYGWVGLALVSAFVGPIWHWLDPFATLHDIGAWVIRRLPLQPWEPESIPTRFRIWPAVVGLTFFVWLELAYRGAELGVVLIAYTAVTLAAMAQFGRDPWREHGETFSVWFRTLNRLAPFASTKESALVRRRPFAAGLIEPGWTTAHLVLIAVGVGSILYDGLSQTQPWFEFFGLPSLPVATAELLAFLGLIVAAAMLVARLVGTAPLAAGLLPISVGYLLAHYLTFLLGDGQRIVVALSDPLQLGWDLFGTAFYEPGTDWIPPSLLWTVQLGAVVGGHILGAWSGHAVAARESGEAASVRRRQIPLAALMVALTVTTLWSLGQNLVSEPESTAARASVDVIS